MLKRSAVAGGARIGRRLLGGALALSALPSAARAQGWPTQPVRIVVSSGAGGSSDLTARMIAARLQEILGQTFLVENRPGGGGVVGTDYVARAPRDGSVFLLANPGSMVIAAGIYRNLPYDPIKDFAPVAPIVLVPICLAVTTKGYDIRTMPELVALMKANPGKLSYATNGIGSTSHISTANFLAQTGCEALHVPYRSGGASLTALLSGEVQIFADSPAILAPPHRAGAVRCLVNATDDRTPLIPEMPTSAEVGLPNFKAYSWFGLAGPAATPQPVVDRLSDAVAQCLADPALSRRFEELALPPMRGYTPARFGDYIKAEIDTWVPIVRSLGITSD
jgi:tripartite-type tricarboxylate transporter receptor subunit TctC